MGTLFPLSRLVSTMGGRVVERSYKVAGPHILVVTKVVAGPRCGTNGSGTWRPIFAKGGGMSQEATRWLSTDLGARRSLLALILVGASCTSRGPSPAPPPPNAIEAAGFSLNASPKPADFVIEAQNSIRIQTGAVLSGGDLGARGTGSGPFLSGNVAIDLLTGAQVQTTHNVIARTSP